MLPESDEFYREEEIEWLEDHGLMQPRMPGGSAADYEQRKADIEALAYAYAKRLVDWDLDHQEAHE